MRPPLSVDDQKSDNGANPQAFNLLNPLGEGVVLGPFFEAGIFKTTVEELAKVAVLAAQHFGSFFNGMADREPPQARVQFHELAGRWFEEYHGAPYDPTMAETARALLDRSAPI